MWASLIDRAAFCVSINAALFSVSGTHRKFNRSAAGTPTQLATIASIGADTISFEQQFHCSPEKPIEDFIKSLHALMRLQHEGQDLS